MTTTHPDEIATPAPGPSLPEGRLYIDGAWQDSQSDERRDVINPATAVVMTTVAEAGEKDVAAAVAAARRAYDEGPWPRMPLRERARILNRAAELIRTHAAELAKLESVDTGKPVHFAEMIDLGATIGHFEYYAALAWSLDGSVRETAIPSFSYVRREPIGVVAAITPFNFPLILSTLKIAPALAAGNTVVHKPAEDTPLTALRMADLLAEAGVPAGVFNVVTGGGPTGELLLRHPAVDKVAFTGSTGIGRKVATIAAETLKHVTLELGGKSANIIFADADLESAIGASVNAFVFNTGQFCMAGTRLLVERPVYDDVVAGVAAAAGGVPVGDPTSPQTVVGPLTGERHLAKVQSYVDAGTSRDGATVLAGGGRIESLPGYYFAPTLLGGLNQGSPLVQEEIFGPVLTVQAFDTEDEAVALANGTPYGLAAGLHTTKIARAHQVAARLQAGMVWVNTWGMLDVTLPAGGYKQSGYGREQGSEGLAEYTQTKSVFVSLG
ncbi:MAG: aldehyde dehydrogenase [Micromonosporaceae bacterium]|nr:aldehyde dehydrogenase [Micromonosporaceae bacterium]